MAPAQFVNVSAIACWRESPNDSQRVLVVRLVAIHEPMLNRSEYAQLHTESKVRAMLSRQASIWTKYQIDISFERPVKLS